MGEHKKGFVDPQIHPGNSTKEEIVKEYRVFVHHIARRFSRCSNTILDQDDFYTVGMLGLLDAIEKYDLTKKNQFKTYAEFRIRGSIVDELRKLDWLSRSARDKQKKYIRYCEKMKKTQGRLPSKSELKKSLNYSNEEILEVQSLCLKKMTSLPVFSMNAIRDESSITGTDYEKEDLKKRLLHHLKKLPKRGQKMIKMRFFEGSTLREIAKTQDLSEVRISQLIQETIEFLRKQIHEELKQEDQNLAIQKIAA